MAGNVHASTTARRARLARSIGIAVVAAASLAAAPVGGGPAAPGDPELPSDLPVSEELGRPGRPMLIDARPPAAEPAPRDAADERDRPPRDGEAERSGAAERR